MLRFRRRGSLSEGVIFVCIEMDNLFLTPTKGPLLGSIVDKFVGKHLQRDTVFPIL